MLFTATVKEVPGKWPGKLLGSPWGNNRGPRNGAFGKPCLCPRESRAIFVIFVGSRDFEQQKPLFYWLGRKFVIFAVFVKNPLFLAGQKHGLPKAPFLGPRNKRTNAHKELSRDTPCCVFRLSHGHVPSVPSRKNRCSKLFGGGFFPGVGRATACGHGCGNGGEGSCGGILLFSPTVWAGSGGEGRDTHTHTHTHTNTHTHTHWNTHTHRNVHANVLHLPFSDLPLKKCPNVASIWGGGGQNLAVVFDTPETAVFGRTVACRWHHNIQKYASDPRPLHTRQKYEQTSGQNMTPNASKQGKFGSLGAICLFIFLPCMWGLGLQKNSPNITDSGLFEFDLHGSLFF